MHIDGGFQAAERGVQSIICFAERRRLNFAVYGFVCKFAGKQRKAPVLHARLREAKPELLGERHDLCGELHEIARYDRVGDRQNIGVAGELFKLKARNLETEIIGGDVFDGDAPRQK